MTYRQGLSLCIVEKAHSQWVFSQVLVGLQHGLQSRADLKPLFGQVNSLIKEPCPRQDPVLAVCSFEHAYRTRDADRSAAEHGIFKRQWFAIGAQEQLRVCACGRRFTPVVSGDFLAVKIHQKCAAPDATRLGLHKPQHHLHCNGRINRRTTCSQNLVPGLCGQRVGCRDRLACIGPTGFFGDLAGHFGLHRYAGRQGW